MGSCVGQFKAPFYPLKARVDSGRAGRSALALLKKAEGRA
jgi:hypothetical protein